MKVRVFDLKEYMERDGYTTVGGDKKALIKGEHGLIWIDWEYIHEVKDVITDSVRIYGGKKPENPNSFLIMPTMYRVEQLSELEKSCNIIEMEVEEFFRNPNYNGRLAGNYSTFQKSLREIGYTGDFNFAGKE